MKVNTLLNIDLKMSSSAVEMARFWVRFHTLFSGLPLGLKQKHYVTALFVLTFVISTNTMENFLSSEKPLSLECRSIIQAYTDIFEHKLKPKPRA